MKEPLHPQFIEMLNDLLGDEASDLIKAMDTEPVTAVRLNRRKPGAIFPDAKPVEWCKSGFYLNERPEFISDPLLHAGAYYVQDASSMMMETVAETLVNRFQNEHHGAHIRVLDLCAAPGGKTTAIINALPEGSEIVANEYSQKRVGALRENLTKWGYPLVKVTNKDSAFYAQGGEQFDIVVVDAPCSGEGMMRKDEFARKQWTPKLIENCSSLQKEILENAVKALKPGGFLIYSTCTFNRKENEENAEYIADKTGINPIDLHFPEEWQIPGGIDTNLPVMRFMPHKTKGEGLFLAVFKKPGTWQPEPGAKTEIPLKRIRNKSNEELPEIEEIMKCGVNLTDIPRVELTKEMALAYLRRESITPPEGAPKGTVILTYKGLNLGGGKNIGSRINNLYPKHWRILKR